MEESLIIVGKNPVTETLRSDQEVERVYVLKDNNDHILAAITKQAKKKGILVSSVDKRKLDSLAGETPHQGVVAKIAPIKFHELDEVLENLKEKENVILVLLDHITDPHNFGAIIRSAEFSGADGLIFPKRRSATLTEAALKASSGATAYLPLIKVNNLSQAIEKLKEAGYWVFAADMKGEDYYKSNLKGKSAIIFGSEGKGLSPKIKDLSDLFIRIPDYGKIESLNVSCAAAVILSEAARQQHSD